MQNQKGSLDRTHKNLSNGEIKEFKNLSANQDFIFLDGYTALSYDIFGISLALSAKIPIYTEWNENNEKADRDIVVMFGSFWRIF